jgi:predicted CopG family antitoxin
MAMGTKTITITEEAYKALAREKRENESFSEVIARLTREAGKLKDSFGSWKMDDEEAQELFAILRGHWHKATESLIGESGAKRA